MVESHPAHDSGRIFVGRHREMVELTAALNDALAGHGRMVVLAGEPGIGKTRTAEELAVLAETRGAQVLWGRCYEEQGAPPYWPWVLWTQSPTPCGMPIETSKRHQLRPSRESPGPPGQCGGPLMGRGVQPVTHMLSQGLLGFLLRSTDDHPGFTEVCPSLAEGSAWRALENVPAARTSLGSGDDAPGRSL